MSSPGQKRGSCGHTVTSFDGHAFCARCRDKKKGEDPCVKSPDSECNFCTVLTPEQLTQLSTPSYRLKKEKREARKMEATPVKDNTLVDPSSVAVIGPVSTATSGSSPPPAVPAKKVKKDKPASSKSKKSSGKSVEDTKYDELDKKWTDRFNRLEALLMAKSLQSTDQPTFSASVRVPPSHSPPAAISKDSEPFFQPLSSGRTGTDSSVLVHHSASPSRMLLLSALEKTSLLISICHPASLCPTNRLSDLLHHQSALATTRLRNISQPASLSRTDTGQGPLHLGALAGIPLSLNINQPASLAPTGTDLPLMLVPTLLPTDLQKAKSGPTDLNLLWPPTPALLLCVDRDAIVLLVGALLLVRITLTDHLSTYTQKRESYQKIRSVLLLSQTKPLVKNRLIGRP